MGPSFEDLPVLKGTYARPLIYTRSWTPPRGGANVTCCLAVALDRSASYVDMEDPGTPRGHSQVPHARPSASRYALQLWRPTRGADGAASEAGAGALAQW